MNGTLGLKKGSVLFKNDLETTLVLLYIYVIDVRKSTYVHMYACI